jgi:hypothetical protein
MLDHVPASWRDIVARLPLLAFPIAEARHHFPACDRKFERVHEMMLGHVPRRSGSSAVEEEPGAGRDAHVADREKNRACRLTLAVDANAFARR